MANNNPAQKPDDNEQSYSWQPEVFENSGEANSQPQGNLHPIETDQLSTGSPVKDPERKFEAARSGEQATPRKKERLRSTNEPNNNVDSLEQKGSSSNESFYKPSGDAKRSVRTRLKGVVKKKKNLVGGGVVGLIIGGGLFGFSILSGPLQFVHIAQLLSGFHFETLENVTDDRASRLWRYARHHSISDPDGSNPKRRYRRLGEVGNIFANGVEARLQDRGITAEYNTRSNFDGYTFDPNTYENGRFRGDPNGLRNHLESRGITAEIHEGRVRAPAEGGYFQQRRLVNRVASEAGYGKILSKVSGRVLRIRGLVTFHPITRANEATRSSISEWWAKRRQYVNDGDTGVEARANDYGDEEDYKNRNNTDPDTEQPTPREVDVDGDTIERVRSSGGLKSAAAKGSGLGGAAATIACVAYGASSNYDQLAHENVNQPLMRLGMEHEALGAQIQSGSDFNINQLDRYADPLYDEEAETSWASARSIQHELGEPLTGPDIPDSAQPSANGNPISGILSPISGFCNALGSPAGQLATLLVDVASGPVSAILAGADFAFDASGRALEFVTNWIARDPVDIENLAGAELGGALNYGVRLAANDQFIAQGGQKLNGTDTAKLDAVNNAIERQERKQLAFTDRLFNPTDAKSLVSRLSYSVPRSLDSSVYYALHTLFSSPTNLFTPEAYAQESYSYGFDEYGFSQEDLNDPRIHNPYENFEKLTSQYDLSDLSDEYGGDCFGVKVDDEGNVEQLENGVNMNTIPDKCSSEEEKLLRFRFFLLDMGVANAGACYYGDTEACRAIGMEGAANATESQQSGVSGQIIGDPNAPSANIQCATGTKDLGTSTPAYNNGERIPTRLCEIQEFTNTGVSGAEGYVTGSTGGVIVNSRVSGAWLALYEDAKADGVTLRANSAFRTMEHQEELWVRYGQDTAVVAQPGYSMHQSGHAIDFINIGGKKRGATCETRVRVTDSETWVWLEENARDYGFGVYAVEPWHWDALDVSNRC